LHLQKNRYVVSISLEKERKISSREKLTPSGLYFDRGPVPLNSSRTSLSFFVESEKTRKITV
jgi:hypothetical protein